MSPGFGIMRYRLGSHHDAVGLGKQTLGPQVARPLQSIYATADFLAWLHQFVRSWAFLNRESLLTY